MFLVDRGRAVAGLCYVDNLVDAAILALRHEAAPGHAFNVSDGLDVTWKEFTDALAKGLGCSQVRWSLPYWIANGIGFSPDETITIVSGEVEPDAERSAPPVDAELSQP